MKALHFQGTELYAPHYYGYEVYFGLDDHHRGVLSHLTNEIILRKWLMHNPCPSLIEVQGHRVTFENKIDAERLYAAFGDGE